MVKTHNEKNNSKKIESNKTPLFTMIIIFVAIVIISSSIMLFSDDEDISYEKYNNFRFDRYGKYWITSIARNGEAYDAIFYNHPLDVEHYPYDNNVTKLTLDKPHTDLVISLTAETNASAVTSAANIARITGKFFKLPTSSALYVPKELRSNYSDYNYTMIDCSEATELRPVIWIRVGENETKVHLHPEYPNCILIDSKWLNESDKIGDLYSYKILEIIR